MGFFSRLMGIPDLTGQLEDVKTVVPDLWGTSENVKAVTGTPEFVRTLQDGYWPGAYGQMYRRQPAVRASVDWLARNIAQLNPKVYERLDDDDRLSLAN